jgi:trk system potassium uptake protein TrkA
MSKQALVVGLGQFGMSLARSLTDLGVDVMAVDIREELVNVAAAFVAEAANFDATDERSLAGTAPQNRDVCVCAIGEEARDASFICTALLHQMGAPRLIARGGGATHERILRMVGADEVVNPERDFGQRLAGHLIHEGVLGEYPLGEELTVTEIKVPKAFEGRSLRELELPRRHGLTVVAMQRENETMIALDPDQRLRPGDLLVTVSLRGMAAKLMEKFE